MGCLWDLRPAFCKHLRHIHMRKELQAKSSCKFYLQCQQHYVVNNSAPYYKASKLQTSCWMISLFPGITPLPNVPELHQYPVMLVPFPSRVSEGLGHREGEYSQPWTHTAELFLSKHTSRRQKTCSHFVQQTELQHSDPKQRSESQSSEGVQILTSLHTPCCTGSQINS